MSASSLWFSLSFDISIMCFIISSGLGWPVAVAGWAVVEPVAVAGDVAGLCANEGLAISTANRIVINDVKVFIVRILPVTHRSWQATSAKISHRTKGRGSKYGRISAISLPLTRKNSQNGTTVPSVVSKSARTQAN